MISAAGQAAKVPSRIGSETEAVISETHPNGTAIEDGEGLAGSLELSDAQPTVKTGAESVRDTYYNIGSAAVILFLFLAVAGIFFCLRARVRKDKAARSSLGHYEARPSTSSRSGRRRSHKRGMSSMSSVKTRTSSVGEDPHELEELVKHEDFDPEAQQGDYFPVDSNRKQRRDEEVFSLGDSDEEQGGDIGRSTDDR